MQHTNEKTKTQTTTTGPEPAELVDWAALKQEKAPSAYHTCRAKKPASKVVTWRILKEGEKKSRSPVYQELIPGGWQKRTQNLENIIKFIKEETQKPLAQVSFEVKENGICTLIFLERLPDASPVDKMYFRVYSIEGKQGPWDTTGTDLGDLRTSSFHMIVKSMLDGCNFEVPKASFPDGPPPGLLVQAELLFGTKTSHMTVTQMIFKIQNMQGKKEKMEIFKLFTLKMFGVSLYSKNESLFDEGKSTVKLLPLFTVNQILSYWENNVQYKPSFALETTWRLHRVPQMFFQGGFSSDDENVFREFFIEHCNAGAGEGKEGFIMKHMSEYAVHTLWKVKPVYKKNIAHFFQTAPNNALLLLMPHGAPQGCLPLGFICAPPLNVSKNPRYGREIAATFFEPVTDPERGDFGVVFKGGGNWNGIEDLLRIYKKLLELDPECVHDVNYGVQTYGYQEIKYTYNLDDEPCTCLVREAHARNYVIKALDMSFLTTDDGQKIVAAYHVNQIVPQRNSLEGMLYALDTHVFAGIVTREHLLRDSKTLEKDFEILNGSERNLTFLEKCEYLRPFPNVPQALDAWDDQKFDAIINANITHLTPGLSPDSIKTPCNLLKYHQVLSSAMKQKYGPLHSARCTVQPIKTTEAIPFIQAREWWGVDFDLIATCKKSKAPRAAQMAALLEESKGGKQLSTEEINSIIKFLKGVKSSWTRNLLSIQPQESACTLTPKPAPEASKQEQTVPPQSSELTLTGEITQAGPAANDKMEMDVSGQMEMSSGKPEKISRKKLLLTKTMNAYTSGVMDPIVNSAYKVDKARTILLVQEYLERRIEEEYPDLDDMPSPKKAKTD